MKKDKLNIVYEDKFIIVVEKPAKLLTISTANEKEETLFHKVITYEKSKNKNNKVFIVHRLDKDTSGLVMFAKSERIKRILQDSWNNNVKRKYLAIVEGKIAKKSGTVKSYLKETKTLKTYSDKKDGKLGITKYNLLEDNKNYSLLDIEILTGRKNQIRVHMSDIGYPIVGDKKYGAKTNLLQRLGLHAYYLEFNHPITNKSIVLECKVPKSFKTPFNKEK